MGWIVSNDQKRQSPGSLRKTDTTAHYNIMEFIGYWIVSVFFGMVFGHYSVDFSWPWVKLIACRDAMGPKPGQLYVALTCERAIS